MLGKAVWGCVSGMTMAAEGQCGIGFLEAHLEDLLQHVSSCGSPVFALQRIFLLNFSIFKSKQKICSSLCVIKEEMRLEVTESWRRNCSRFIQYLNTCQSSPDCAPGLFSISPQENKNCIYIFKAAWKELAQSLSQWEKTEFEKWKGGTCMSHLYCNSGALEQIPWPAPPYYSGRGARWSLKNRDVHSCHKGKLLSANVRMMLHIKIFSVCHRC